MRLMTQVPDFFGRRLSAALLLRGVTQKDFAKRVGVSLATMTRICSQGYPPSELLMRVLKSTLGAKTWAYCVGETDVLTEGK